MVEIDDKTRKQLAEIMEHMLDESQAMVEDANKHRSAIVEDATKIALILTDIDQERN